MKGKNIIVTGATGAIGRALVEAAVGQNAATVVLACRNVARAEEIAAEIKSNSSRLIPMMLDLASFESVEKFVDDFGKLGIPLDGIFNTAGAMPARLIITADGNEMATQVNCLAPLRLTHLLAPLMSDGAFVVMTTSVTRKVFRLHGDNPAEWNKSHFSRYGTYGRSKRMLTEAVPALADELAEKNIRVNCADPGVVDSRMINVNRIIDPLANIFFRPFIRKPRKGAVPALRAAASPLSCHVFTLKSQKPIH